jgi:hypothetical protein
LLYYISTKNISLALLILASVVLSMCTIHKQKQNLIIVSMMRRKITSHKRRRHQLKLLRRRKALKLKLLLKKIMIIMKRRMAARKRQPAKVKTVADEDYSKLDQYAIELHEFYKSLRKAGFTNDNALWLLSAKDSFPDWLQKKPTLEDVRKHLEDEEDD